VSAADPYVAVCGPGTTRDEALLGAAEDVGAGIAEAGAILVCGGLGGVMEAAARGARSKLGTVLGLLPGDDRRAANGWVTVAVPTGLGELRNGLVVRSADVVVAVGAGTGTLSEVALAIRTGVPVVGLGTWDVEGVRAVGSAEEVVLAVRELLGTPAASA
jgi:uncharacterized protein (TIGR00725 family)